MINASGDEISSLVRKIILYGDVNLNIIDGSAIWLLSMAETLSMTRSKVTLLLKATVYRPGVLDRISKIENIEVIDPFSNIKSNHGLELTPRSASQRLAQIDDEISSDIIICRGSKISAFVANSPKLAGKSWLYMTDIPHPINKIDPNRLLELRRIADASKRMFAQTLDAQSYLESIAPEACGKTLILSPMIPDEYYDVRQNISEGGMTKLVYSGKFAKDWRTLEMCSLPSALWRKGFNASLTMIGDKFQSDPKNPQWSTNMEKAIHSSGIDWLGGMSRDEAAMRVADHDLSLSWRTARMNESFEISTKVLESAAMGVPPLINRTAAHEAIFGSSYPFFIENESLDAVAAAISRAGVIGSGIRKDVSCAVSYYSYSFSAARLEKYFSASEADYLTFPRLKAKQRVLLAGHDFKFAAELVDILVARDDIELKFDRWDSLHAHDEKHSEVMSNWADVVICEWAGPNAVWYSNNKRRHQKLIVRLHMFELRGPWLGNIVVESIDTLVCVSDLYGQRVRATPGWENANIRVIPNMIDRLDLERPKLDDSQFRLGLVGIVPMRKRLDRAVDLMQGLLERDSRFTLHIRGRMPWEYSYEWRKSTQQLAYRELFAKIGSDEDLFNSIVFEPFGADMGSWFRKIGFIISPSSDESFHLAPAEGMAAGSVPVLWSRPGLEGIFGNKWKVSDTASAVEFIHNLSLSREEFLLHSQSAKEFSSRFDISVVARSWLSEVL